MFAPALTVNPCRDPDGDTVQWIYHPPISKGSSKWQVARVGNIFSCCSKFATCYYF